MRAGASRPRPSLAGLITPLLQKAGGNVFETYKKRARAAATRPQPSFMLSTPLSLR
jgi:hypothetical protein